MNIHEAAQITGLSKKTLRFYEDKGLIVTVRGDNLYRNYTDEDIDSIKRIKLLRSIGVSISDISLLQNNIITLNEVVMQRIKSLQEDMLNNKQQLELCNEIIDIGDNWNKLIALKSIDLNLDNDIIVYEKNEPVSIGIDIGTSTISLVVIDTAHKPIDIYNIPNNATVKGEIWEHIQDPDIIYSDILKVLRIIERSHLNIVSIGLTGQMHGTLYVDSEGNCASNLRTWLDKSADQLTESGLSFVDEIKLITELDIPAGFGVATHYALSKSNTRLNSYKLCTIMDYVAMKLSGSKVPVIHYTNAASLGGYDIVSKKFCSELSRIIDLNILPEIVSDDYICGLYNGVTPVKVAIGDHQACILGSIGDSTNTLHINIGTGSQISLCCESTSNVHSEIEIRPHLNGKYIKCYSALCGGLSYSLMEKFIRRIVNVATGNDFSQYNTMDQLIRESLPGNNAPIVEPYFCGTRINANLVGSINCITTKNFDPGSFIIGILRGIVRELYEKYLLITNDKCTTIVATGNAVRKNSHLVNIIAETFGCKVQISDYSEEAAIGAAIHALN